MTSKYIYIVSKITDQSTYTDDDGNKALPDIDEYMAFEDRSDAEIYKKQLEEKFKDEDEDEDFHFRIDRLKIQRKERETMSKYKVYLTGGSNDDALLGSFDSEDEAIKFARAYQSEHETEFDPVCGGVMIQDSDGNVVEEW